MTRNSSRSRRGARFESRAPVPAALAFVGLYVMVGLVPPPAEAADNDPVVSKDELVGKLIPITGDPLERRSVDLRVEFGKNSAEVGEDATAQLRELGAALVSDALRDLPVGVYGHTDTGGPADFNQSLSERRAKAVAAYLREHFAMAGGRFREVQGYGEERPRADLPPTDPAQRRVEIVTFHPLWREEPEVKEEEEEEAASAPAAAPADPSDSGVVVIGADDAPAAGSDETSARAPTDEGGEEKTKKVGGIVVIE